MSRKQGTGKKKEFVQATVGFIQRVEPSTANSLGTVRSAYNFSQFLSGTEVTYGK